MYLLADLNSSAQERNCSLELRRGVAVSLESTVDDIGALVDEIWHDWLIHGTIPWHVSRLSHSVSIAGTMVLVEDWRLSGAPLAMSIWNRRIARQYSCKIPPEQVWVVQKSPLMESVVVEYNRSLVSQSSSNTT